MYNLILMTFSAFCCSLESFKRLSAVSNSLIDTQVVKYWPDKGKSGFLVWRYLLKRDDDEPAPWTRDGKDRIKKLGLTMQVKIRNICRTDIS